MDRRRNGIIVSEGRKQCVTTHNQKIRRMLLPVSVIVVILIFGVVAWAFYPMQCRGMHYEYSLNDVDIANLNASSIETVLRDNGYDVEVRDESPDFAFTIHSGFEPRQAIHLVRESFDGRTPDVYFYGDVEYEHSILLSDPRIEYGFEEVQDLLDEELVRITLLLNLSGTFKDKYWGDNDFDVSAFNACDATCCLIVTIGAIVGYEITSRSQQQVAYRQQHYKPPAPPTPPITPP